MATAEMHADTPTNTIGYKNDLYGGVIVDADSLPQDEDVFSTALDASLKARSLRGRALFSEISCTVALVACHMSPFAVC